MIVNQPVNCGDQQLRAILEVDSGISSLVTTFSLR
jgi:hypothetical protein